LVIVATANKPLKLPATAPTAGIILAELSSATIAAATPILAPIAAPDVAP